MSSPESPESNKKQKTSSRKPSTSTKTRATRACNACRKQKTRCFPSPNSIGCLRCSSLGHVCSFEEEAIENSMTSGTDKFLSSREANFANVRPLTLGFNGSTDNRIRSIQTDVSEILRLLKNSVNTVQGRSNQENNVQNDAKLLLEAAATAQRSQSGTPLIDYGSNPLNFNPNGFQKNPDVEQNRTFSSPSFPFMTSPFATMGQTINPNHLPYPIQHLLSQKVHFSDQDIVTLGIISKQQAIVLMQNFRERYGRWVSFPSQISTDLLVDRIRYKCSLLLTTCCCLSLRYSDTFLKSQIYHLLLHKLQVDLNKSLAVLPQSIEFMQALVILSMYALSLSNDLFTIDAWFLSGTALKHFITKDALGTLLDSSNDDILLEKEFKELTVYRIWNHLCLVHLANCVLSGRMCIIDEIRLDQSRKSLDLVNATNFDGRMVSEISILLIAYNFLQTGQSYEIVKEELKLWVDQWGYLFEQPAIQFVEFCYHYCYLLTIYNWNFRKSQNFDNSQIGILSQYEMTLLRLDATSIKSMIYHCNKIIDAILIVEDDSYFAFLSDQIHFNSFFSIVILIRLLELVKNKFNEIDKAQINLNLSLDSILKVSKRFRRVSTGDDDTVYKYAVAIDENLGKYFPEYNLEIISSD